MRVLPDNPHLDFLRQEAKDLLVALRESEPSASLGDAQRALAVEYGFAGWSALKTEVDQRRRQPPIAPDELVDGLVEAFDLGPVTAVRPVSYSPLGRHWSVITDRGRWLAVPGYPWMGDHQAETGERLRSAAAEAGVRSPTPRRSRSGRLVETIAGGPWRVSEWLEQGPVPSLPARAGVARGVGVIAGALHALAIPSEDPINPYLTSRRPDADWQELVRRARTAGRPWADDLAALLPTVAEVGVLGAAVPTDGLLLCNCNLIPETLRLGPGDELIVLEWTFAGSHTAEQEVAGLLAHWALRPALNPVVARAFADGYRERAGTFPRLTRESFGLAVNSQLNWAYNTFCEAISPADPDAADLARREVPEQLRRPLTLELIDQLIAATG
ncbi:hypothetical protein [Microlunatus speluncae]|uniref:hypothetical protein n=1 Tax=Microlunatus speluncae TaxID=2594267 RepID=UPI0012662730|nr:hypothetical protein [Microlunatus speluncae]